MIRLPFSKPTDSLSSVFRYLKYLTVWRIFVHFRGRSTCVELQPNLKWIVVHLIGRSTVRWITSEENVWPGSELCFIFEDALFSLNCNRRELLSSRWIVVHFRGRTAVRWIVWEGSVWKRSELSSIFGTHYLQVDLHSKRTTEPDVRYRPFSGHTTYGLTCIRGERLNPMWIAVHFRGRAIYVELHPKPC